MVTNQPLIEVRDPLCMGCHFITTPHLMISHNQSYDILRTTEGFENEGRVGYLHVVLESNIST